MTRCYSTRTEAIRREIIEPIEAGDATAADYDIDAIAALVLADAEQGFAPIMGAEAFWITVADHERKVL